MVKKNIFMVEYAKSARSTCTCCGEKFPKGELRVGKNDSSEGQLWHHVHCFQSRRTQLGYSNDTVVSTLTGYDDIEPDDQQRLVMMLGPKTDSVKSSEPAPAETTETTKPKRGAKGKANNKPDPEPEIEEPAKKGGKKAAPKAVEPDPVEEKPVAKSTGRGRPKKGVTKKDEEASGEDDVEDEQPAPKAGAKSGRGRPKKAAKPEKDEDPEDVISGEDEQAESDDEQLAPKAGAKGGRGRPKRKAAKPEKEEEPEEMVSEEEPADEETEKPEKPKRGAKGKAAKKEKPVTEDMPYIDDDAAPAAEDDESVEPAKPASKAGRRGAAKKKTEDPEPEEVAPSKGKKATTKGKGRNANSAEPEAEAPIAKPESDIEEQVTKKNTKKTKKTDTPVEEPAACDVERAKTPVEEVPINTEGSSSKKRSNKNKPEVETTVPEQITTEHESAEPNVEDDKCLPEISDDTKETEPKPVEPTPVVDEKTELPVEPESIEEPAKEAEAGKEPSKKKTFRGKKNSAKDAEQGEEEAVETEGLPEIEQSPEPDEPSKKKPKTKTPEVPVSEEPIVEAGAKNTKKGKKTAPKPDTVDSESPEGAGSVEESTSDEPSTKKPKAKANKEETEAQSETNESEPAESEPTVTVAATKRGRAAKGKTAENASTTSEEPPSTGGATSGRPARQTRGKATAATNINGQQSKHVLGGANGQPEGAKETDES